MDLFEHARSRKSDPRTSHDAASAVDVIGLERVVLDALIAALPGGMTVDELVAALSIDKVTISPRLRPLCDKGYAVTAGTRKAIKSNRQQTVWAAKFNGGE